MSHIETYRGLRFSLEQPVFHIEDIAHALSLLCRYNGHCNQFYSVAQHSLMVSYLMEALELGDPLVGLLHDATEAYLSDIPKPFKQLLPEWQKIDDRLEALLATAFGLEYPWGEGCKKADMIALHIEAHSLIHSKGVGEMWPETKGYRLEAHRLMKEKPKWWVLHMKPSEHVEKDFLDRYAQLTEKDKVTA